MLSTFENSAKQHGRRQERQRNLQAIEEIAGRTRRYDESMLVPSVDALVGLPLVKQAWGSPRTAASLLQRRRWRRRLWTGIVLLVFFVIAILLTMATTKKITLHSDARLARFRKLYSLVVDWGYTPESSLLGSSAAAKALDWLAFEDEREVDEQTLQTRFALATLYFSASGNGTMWINHRHWMSAFPVCLWHGVECLDEDSTVEMVGKLNLSSNDLSGSLPDELALLGRTCEILDLSYNEIGGKLPTTLGNAMINLRQLYLGPNHFTSLLPTSLSQLSQLTHLYLNDCFFTGSVPSALWSLTLLQSLDLHANLLTGQTSESVGQLTHLSALYLDQNNLVGEIPTTTGQLTNLVDLRLGDNRFRGRLPTHLARLAKLQQFSVENNALTGPLSIFGAMFVLRELRAYNNRFAGSVPHILTPTLTTLYLDSNELSGTIPTTLGNLVFLRSLFLSNNRLTGSIPPVLGALQHLAFVHLEDNHLFGSVPSLWCDKVATDTMVLAVDCKAINCGCCRACPGS